MDIKFNDARAIIIKNNQLVVMEREKNGIKFCAFPGGHLESGETPEQCVAREVEEEMGIIVEPIRMLYTYLFQGKWQAFYLCKWISGSVHVTNAEEYQSDRQGGYYNPTTISLSEMQKKNVVPPEIRNQLLKDLDKYGLDLNRPTINVMC